MLLGDEIIVLDLKTHTMDAGELPAWVQFQLTVYAHLIERAYGSLPDRAEVFSLNRGFLPVPLTQATLEAALDAVSVARAADSNRASPSPDVCFFCERRLECQPQWDAAAAWQEADCVEGTITRSEFASSGVSAVQLETVRGSAWVSGVPTQLMTVAIGDHLRFVRLRRVAAGVDGDVNWRWGAYSAFGLGPDSGSAVL